MYLILVLSPNKVVNYVCLQVVSLIALLLFSNVAVPHDLWSLLLCYHIRNSGINSVLIKPLFQKKRGLCGTCVEIVMSPQFILVKINVKPV